MVLYAVGSTVVIVRTIMLLLGVTDRVWIGRIVFGSTSLLTDPLERVPGLGFQIIGPLSMVDVILLAIVVLFPLGLIASTPRS